MMRITDTVKHLIILNVLMFVGTMTVGDGRLFYDLFAMHFPASDAFKPWQVVTHMFMHGGFTHLLFNMFALWMFGGPVEQRLGRNKFLFLYFSAGLAAVLFQLAGYYWNYLPGYTEVLNSGVTADQFSSMMNSGKVLEGLSTDMINSLQKSYFAYNSTMVGASGCIMGVLAAFGMMNPNAELMMLFLPIPIKAKYFIPGIILLDVISAFTGQSFFSPSNTAYLAHVGGALMGFFIMWYWRKTQFNKNRWDR
ncbi:rhomboid family intramembrane serine protease [Olleya sp. HaHaR_3_96]|uniref:rhomboid family intramembrane serine protease n=1 Tax=Olleya sp. HaHaR_3_96 TaxID=2745560 RepID=UPI001C4F8BC4|nr:rhomboid family intramembrane serine protease [Olleya sp. HaHaR_3_96]QXP59677.1 rhomboid family intramembrane serine protease [Olleya sp. HaHaR_3_96]